MCVCVCVCVCVCGAIAGPVDRRSHDRASRVKSSKFGHQVISDTHLQIAEILMRRLFMSCLIRIFTVCAGNLVFNSNN